MALSLFKSIGRFLGFVTTICLLLLSNIYAQTNLCMKPNTVRLIPNASFQPNWSAADANGNSVPITTGLSWVSSNPSIVSVSSTGVFSSTGNLGEATITASWNGLTYQTKVKVVNDFVSTPAERRIVKVAMIIIDPQIPAAGGKRFSETFWAGNGGPMALAKQTRDSMFSISGGTIDYQFTEIHQEPTLMTKFGGTLLSVDSMYRLFLEPNWTTLHRVSEQLNQSEFLYNDLLNKYDLCNKSNSHQVDEVWIWAMPFVGLAESNMTGTGAFWINGAVISGNSCTDLLPMMGFNYERYAGCALHNFSHRIETTMYKVFNTNVRYAPSDPPYPAGVPKNTLQTFMLYDALETGNAHLGNSHFPPNGTDGYDYDNLNSVLSRAPNWKRYPYLFDQTKSINCTEWGCEGDCGLNFMSYWMRHIPHFKCKDKTGLLNNWWTYIIDYNEGKALETQTDNRLCKMFDDDIVATCDHKGVAPWELWISKVQFNTLNNASDKFKDFATLGYSDFTNLSTTIQKGLANTLQITPGLSWSGNLTNAYCRVWIDYNGNNTFESTELVFQNTNVSPFSANIRVPSSAILGNVKMRVAMKWGAYPDPCETFEKGEVEDYTVVITEPTEAYCTSKGTAPWELWISKIQFNTINNASDKFKDFATLGYSDYTNLSTTVQKGQSYAWAASPGLSWLGNLSNVYCRAWIDFNGNKTFESSEMVFQNNNTNPFTGNVAIPSSAVTGNTRMRVAMKWGGYPEPCEVFARGEVEDYEVNIMNQATNGTDTLRLVSVSGATAVRQGGQITLNVVIKNTGITPSNPNTPLSIYQNQQPFIFRGPPPTYLTIVSERTTIGRAIQPNETVTVPVTFTMYTNFSHITRPDYSGTVFNGTYVVIGNRSNDVVFFPYTNPVLDTLAIPYNLTAILDNGDLKIDIVAPDSTYKNDGKHSFIVKITNNGTTTAKDVIANIGNITSSFSTSIFTSPTVTPQRGTISYATQFGSATSILWNISTLAPNESLTAGVEHERFEIPTILPEYIHEVFVGSNQFIDNNNANNKATKRFVLNNTATTYCASKGTTPWEQWIEHVWVATGTGSTTFPATSKDGYGNFTNAAAATIQRGQACLIGIDPKSSWGADPRNANMFWRAWIDLNNDNDFDDAGEMVISRQVVIFAGGFLDNEQAFTLPATASLGRTRLRIAMKVGGYPSPCETFERGEVEDYMVNITNATTMIQPLMAFGNLKALLVDGSVRLDWVKYSDKITGFDIEKSLDGQIFSFMKKVAVTPFDAYYYGYDTQPTEGVNFYRLKMTLNNGEVAYSNTQTVHYQKLTDFTIFPNPSNEEVYVDLKAFENKTLNLSISNLVGQIVLHQTFKSAPHTPHRLDISKFESGVYFVRIEAQGYRAIVRKLEIIK